MDSQLAVKNSQSLLKLFNTPKCPTVSKQNIKADGSASLNTRKQALSKTEVLARLAALLAPAPTSRSHSSPHLLTAIHSID